MIDESAILQRFKALDPLLDERGRHCDRNVVMRDGNAVAGNRASAFDRDKLVQAMGGADAKAREARGAKAPARGQSPLRVRARPSRQIGSAELVAHQGEVIGLAGLAGHGQTELLLAIFAGASRARANLDVGANVALIAGDRQADGIFLLWSIGENIGVRSLARLRRGLLISRRREDALANFWRD